MYWPVVVFEMITWVILVGLLLWQAYASYRRRRIVPGLWLWLGCFSMSWVEPPFDNAAYVQFDPNFHRLPAWGVFGMTQGQLPLQAPLGYILYFLMTAMAGVGIARVLINRFRLPKATTLLVCGFAFGFLFDLTMETLEARYAHLWVMARAIPGLTIHAGLGLVPLTMSLALGCFIMGATYVLGNLTSAGDSVIDVWAKSHAGSSGTRRVLQALGYVVFCNVLYLLVYAPFVITKNLGMLTETGVLEPFPGRIPVQPESGAPQANGALGALIQWGWLWGMVALTVWWAKRTDRLLIAPTFVPSMTGAERQRSHAG
jgi:Spirocyclase AveC-like